MRRAPGAPIGLIPFLVPDWPSRAQFEQAVAALSATGCAAWEFALPAGSRSTSTSAPIATALAATRADTEEALAVLSAKRPGIAVLFGPRLRVQACEPLLDRLAGRCDYLMVETPGEDSPAWIEACGQRGIGWVEVVRASAGARLACERSEALPAGAILYLTAAARTGEAPDDLAILAEAVAAVRRWRPDLFVITGFGISTPEQVERLAAIDGLDAVAVGTTLLNRLEHGADQAAIFFSELHGHAASGHVRS